MVLVLPVAKPEPRGPRALPRCRKRCYPGVFGPPPHPGTRTTTQLWASNTADDLARKKRLPCEGGVAACPVEFAQRQLTHLPGWHLTHQGQRIRKDWTVKNFMAAIDFFNRVAAVAEADGHHPDLHVSGYRQVSVELWTHAIGGLSENDFILAAKIEQVPIELRPSP